MPPPTPAVKPGHHAHPHDAHPSDHPCPDHFHRCYATFHGYIDCPSQPHIKPMKTEMLTVSCGADDPKPQIQAFLNQPGHAHALVLQVLDLSHNGWLVIFSVPE